MKKLLKEWDPSMSTDKSAPFNQSDWDELITMLVELAEHDGMGTFESLYQPSETDIERWVAEIDYDDAIWSKYENKIDVPGQSFKADDIEGYENEIAPLVYPRYKADLLARADDNRKLQAEDDRYSDLYGGLKEGFGDYKLENYLDDMSNHEFVDADPGDKLKLKTGEVVWVVNYEGGNSFVVTDNKEMLQSYGKSLQYQTKKRNPEQVEDFHGLHKFDNNEYYTWIVSEDEISHTIAERDVIVEGKRTIKPSKMVKKQLKESIEPYIPEQIKAFQFSKFSKVEITLDDPEYKIIDDFFEKMSEEDTMEEFLNWCHSKNFTIDYDNIYDIYTIRNVGGINESKKTKLTINEVGRGLNLDEVDSEIFTEEEKVIIDIVEKSYKDYTLLKSHYNVDYITLNLSTELDEEIGNDLELQRYRIASELAQFRQDFISDLSSELPVVNVKVGPYQFVKGSDRLIFNVTILLSDTGVKEWVSGKMTKGTKKAKK